MGRLNQRDWAFLQTLLPVALLLLFVSGMTATSTLLFEVTPSEANRVRSVPLLMLALFFFTAIVSGLSDVLLGVAAGWLLGMVLRLRPEVGRAWAALALLLLVVGGGLLLVRLGECLPLALQLPSFSFALVSEGVLPSLEWAALFGRCRPAGPAAAVLFAPNPAAAAAAYRAVATDIAGLWWPNWGLGLFWLAFGLRLRRPLKLA